MLARTALHRTVHRVSSCFGSKARVRAVGRYVAILHIMICLPSECSSFHVAGPWMRLMAWCCRPCCDASCRMMLFFHHHQFTTMVRSVLTNSGEHHRRPTSEAKHDIRGALHTWGDVKPSRYRFGACSTGITSKQSASIPSTARMLVLMDHIC